MRKIRNKIITISGEPASGKSTVVEALHAKYSAMGYRVHIVKTGDEFRKRATKEYLKMFPDRKDANLADIQVDKAFVEMRDKIDSAIDEWVEQLGIEINSEDRPNDVYIIDSRLAWHNIPDSYAIRLTVDEVEAGRRVFGDKTRGNEDAYKSLEEAIEKTRQRKLGEIARYKERYGVDLSNVQNYKLIVDTSNLTPEQLAEFIINSSQKYHDLDGR